MASQSSMRVSSFSKLSVGLPSFRVLDNAEPGEDRVEPFAMRMADFLISILMSKTIYPLQACLLHYSNFRSGIRVKVKPLNGVQRNWLLLSQTLPPMFHVFRISFQS